MPNVTDRRRSGKETWAHHHGQIGMPHAEHRWVRVRIRFIVDQHQASAGNGFAPQRVIVVTEDKGALALMGRTDAHVACGHQVPTPTPLANRWVDR